MATEAKGGRAAAVERVVLAHDDGSSGEVLLEDALERAGLWPALMAARRAAGRRRKKLHVTIRPDLTALDTAPHSSTDPALVEALVDLLHARGHRSVSVVAAAGSRDGWLENRGVVEAAKRLGYRGRTGRGNRYAVVDLADDTVDLGLPAGSPLHQVRVGRAWVESGFRIVFAKNRTHEAHAYALCLETLLGVLPWDGDADLSGEGAPAVACALLDAVPPHFCIVDAVVSGHGAGGTLGSRPLPTRTVIAGRSVLLTDWVAAARMKVDPHASPLNALALARSGLPARYRIDGDLTPYPGWSNVHPLVLDAWRELGRFPALRRLAESASLPVDTTLFPFKGQGAARLNRATAPFMAQGDLSPALWGLVALGEAVGTARRAGEAWCTLYAKDLVDRPAAPLHLDPARLAPGEFEAVVDYIEPLERLVATTPAEPSGLRWRYLDGSVLFSFSRTLAIPFDDFVARVEIARAVQYMRDYVGGTWSAIRRDAKGRVTHQAERTLYLPQPNFTVLSGGKPLDVTKLDFVRYQHDLHKVFWRSIGSENGTVEHDDGSVAFRGTGDGRTEVTVVARQKFVLPPLWQAMNLDLHPWYKDRVVAAEYHAFLRETIANYEAQYEGREFRIGRTRRTGSDVDLLDLVGTAVEVGRRMVPDLLGRARGTGNGATGPADGAEGVVGEGGTSRPDATPEAAAEAPRASTLLARSLGRVLGASTAAVRAFATELGRAVADDLGQGPRD